MKFEFCLNKSLNSPQILTHSGHVLEQAPTIYYSIWFIWTVQYLICILESFWWSQRVCLLQPGPSQPTLWRSVRAWRTGGLQTSPTYQTQTRRISPPHWWDFTAKTTEFIQFGECDCVSQHFVISLSVCIPGGGPVPSHGREQHGQQWWHHLQLWWCHPAAARGAVGTVVNNAENVFLYRLFRVTAQR